MDNVDINVVNCVANIVGHITICVLLIMMLHALVNGSSEPMYRNKLPKWSLDDVQHPSKPILRTIFSAVEEQNQHLPDPAGLISRIKAIRILTNASLPQAKWFVEEVYEDGGMGHPKPKYSTMDVVDAQYHINTLHPEKHSDVKSIQRTGNCGGCAGRG